MDRKSQICTILTQTARMKKNNQNAIQEKFQTSKFSRESHTHTHVQQQTQLTRQYRTWNGAYFKCVLMTARHICKCTHVVCTLAWIIWPMLPSPIAPWTAASTRIIRDSVVDDALHFQLGFNAPKHQANLAVTLSCLCLILPYRIQTCRAKLSIT